MKCILCENESVELIENESEEKKPFCQICINNLTNGLTLDMETAKLIDNSFQGNDFIFVRLAFGIIAEMEAL